MDQYDPREITRIFVGAYEMRYEMCHEMRYETKRDLILILPIWQSREERQNG